MRIAEADPERILISFIKDTAAAMTANYAQLTNDCYYFHSLSAITSSANNATATNGVCFKNFVGEAACDKCRACRIPDSCAASLYS